MAAAATTAPVGSGGGAAMPSTSVAPIVKSISMPLGTLLAHVSPVLPSVWSTAVPVPVPPILANGIPAAAAGAGAPVASTTKNDLGDGDVGVGVGVSIGIGIGGDGEDDDGDLSPPMLPAVLELLQEDDGGSGTKAGSPSSETVSPAARTPDSALARKTPTTSIISWGMAAARSSSGSAVWQVPPGGSSTWSGGIGGSATGASMATARALEDIVPELSLGDAVALGPEESTSVPHGSFTLRSNGPVSDWDDEGDGLMDGDDGRVPSRGGSSVRSFRAGTPAGASAVGPIGAIPRSWTNSSTSSLAGSLPSAPAPVATLGGVGERSWLFYDDDQRLPIVGGQTAEDVAARLDVDPD